MKELQQNYIESTRRDFLDNLASEKMDADPAAVASLRSRYSAAVGAPHGAPAAAAGPDVNPGNAQR